jgi:hypothetical protein
MTDQPIYLEKLSSRKTEALFVALTLLFFILFVGFAYSHLWGGWSILFMCLFVIFLFYAVNYRYLVIRLDQSYLRLKFGIFTWTIPLENIADCSLDSISPLQYYGGAGIHFMVIEGRYRAMFNFLEYPRVLIKLKVKQGLVQDIAFSTQQPVEVLRLVDEWRLNKQAT